MITASILSLSNIPPPSPPSLFPVSFPEIMQSSIIGGSAISSGPNAKIPPPPLHVQLSLTVVSFKVKPELIQYFKKDNIEVGIDEAGRGCLAGPVYIAACVWPQSEDPEII